MLAHMPKAKTLAVIDGQTKDGHTGRVHEQSPRGRTQSSSYLSVLMTPCMNPYACQPATILAFLLVDSNINSRPQAPPSGLSMHNTWSTTHSPNTRKASRSAGCWPPPKKNNSTGGFSASNDPMRKKEGATRVTIHADSRRSLITGISGRDMMESERVVGILSAFTAATLSQQVGGMKRARCANLLRTSTHALTSV